ncbi:Ribosomal RNA small subunit methyltransferase H, variant 2 [Balamuthia mandrillaris]
MKGRFFVTGGSCSWRWWHASSSVARKTTNPRCGLCKTRQQASSSPLLPTRYKNTSTKKQSKNEKEALENYETDGDALNSPHVPVLLHECLRALHIREGGLYVDATFGRGGHTQAILESNDTCRVIAVDCDATAFQQEGPRQLFQRFEGRVTPIHGRFGELHALLQSAQVSRVDGILFDLGVSSPQLDTPSRGFSFRPHLSGPLDMRMDQTSSASSSVVSAKEVVNQMGEEELADILWRYGEERNSRKIARNIVRYRQTAAIESTAQLANIVRRAQQQPRAGKGGAGGEKKGIDPATRTFQALRIFVNDELGQLEKGLVAAESLLAEGGHLAG